MLINLKALTVLGLAVCSSAHHLVSNFYVDGKDQGPGTCLRNTPKTNPVVNLGSSDMACNVNGNVGADITCSANAGSKITAQWRIWPDGTNDSPIDISHKGPCSAYMKYIGPHAATGSVAGGGWFKIWHDGVQNGKFCTERIRENGNKMTFTIPKDLAGGHYMLRFETLALHQAQDLGGAQWYIGCAQIFLYSTGGNAKPSNTVSIPGYVKATDAGVHYNMYAGRSHGGYKIPGPAPYVAGNTGGGAIIKTPFNPHPKYSSCYVKNANWCAVPVPSFNSEGKCYEAAQNCWNQLDQCYKTAPPTGNAGCRQWEKICTGYGNYCAQCAPKCNGTFPPASELPNKRSRIGHPHHRA